MDEQGFVFLMSSYVKHLYIPQPNQICSDAMTIGFSFPLVYQYQKNQSDVTVFLLLLFIECSKFLFYNIRHLVCKLKPLSSCFLKQLSLPPGACHFLSNRPTDLQNNSFLHDLALKALPHNTVYAHQ